MSKGEKIGTLYRDAKLSGESQADVVRFSDARMLQDIVMSSVLRGRGLSIDRRGEESDERGPSDSIYVSPPIYDPEEAQKLGERMASALQNAREMYADLRHHQPLADSEFDTFIPAGTEES